jgi:LPS sulfotransferase NodH
MAGQAPKRTLILWMTQRVGSSMLAQALEDTELVGRPREWLNADDGEALLRMHGVGTVRALREMLWTEGTTANGVLGLKHGFVAHRDASFIRLFRDLVEAPDPTPRAVWEAMFPRPLHVFLTRRDKVRLAVSWWRAICSGERAHRRTGEPALAQPPDDAYLFDAIRHLVLETCLREAAMQENFAAWRVVPLTVVYEDMIADYEATVRRVLAFAGVDSAGVAVPPPSYERLADDLNERWVQRFREDAQRDWPKRVW